MTERRKPKPAPQAPAKPRRRRLEGVAYYVIYVPAAFVAGWLVLLFMHGVEQLLYGDDE